MDASGGGPPHRGPAVMEPALRLIQGDAYQWSEQTRSCPVIRGSGYPTRLTEPRLGCSPPGQRQERGEQDALARERPDDAGGLELLRLPPFPIVGLPNRWVTS